MEQNTGISISDWSGIVAMIVSLCALVSPVLTAVCNNKHQRKMKQMEYEHQEQMDRQKYEREIYEGYIRSAGAVLQCKTPEAALEFGEHSRLAMYYVPDAIREKMLQLEKLVEDAYPSDTRFAQRAQLLDEIVVMLRDERESRSSSGPRRPNKPDTTA